MQIQKFDNKKDLDFSLAADIIKWIHQAIMKKGTASILFSGGSTPHGLLETLSQNDIVWEKVKIGLVDDRMVAQDSAFLNANMIQEKLIQKLSGYKPQFYPLVTDHEDPSRNMKMAKKSTSMLGEIDVCILGMGTDGHFASIFPNDEKSQKALFDKNETIIHYTEAPAVPKQRITYSWPFLRKSKTLILHITGQNKMDLLKDKNRDRLPIDIIFNDNKGPLVYWTE